ncbi:MAG: hypothetical protein D3925_02060 [Candidatus Electrothrix sp. AR5]|nr:hypothetical protein [Candidatus Electrothrix sp. AR5]
MASNEQNELLEASKETSTISHALRICNGTIEYHRKQASRFLIYITISLMLLGLFLFFIYSGLWGEISNNSFDMQIIFISTIGFFSISFGVLVSLYRFHQTTALKEENNLTSFLMLDIALGTNPTIEEKVKKMIIDKSFLARIDTKNKKTTSPLPGHPVSDGTTLLVNRLMDLIEKRKI